MDRYQNWPGQYPTQQHNQAPVGTNQPAGPPSGGIPNLPASPYQQEPLAALLQRLQADLAQQQQHIQQLYAMAQDHALRRGEPLLFPAQWRMGIVKFPYLMPRPQVWIARMVESDNNDYATTTNTVATANFTFNNTYTFLRRLTFALYRTSQPSQTNLPVGCWLPLSAHTYPYITANDEYVGKDFFFNITGTSENYVWQSGTDWRPSSDAAQTEGYIFPTEYQTVPQDQISIRAIPLTAAVEGDAYRLYAILHGYKMETPRSGYVPLPGKIVQPGNQG